jgi:hypothetical protein
MTNANIFEHRRTLVLGITTTVQLFAGNVGENGLFGKDVAVIKGHLVCCQDTFASFTIGELTKFGRTSRVHEAIFVDCDGKGLTARNL